MSETGEGFPEREWGFFLDDMIAFAEKVLFCTAGMNRAGGHYTVKRMTA